MKNLLFGCLLFIVLVGSSFEFAIRKGHREMEREGVEVNEEKVQVEAQRSADSPFEFWARDMSSNANKKAERKDMEKYLRDYGYLPPIRKRWSNRKLNKATSKKCKKLGDAAFDRALWKFAIFHGAKMGKKVFAKSGKESIKRTLGKIMNQQRCGRPDIGQGKFKSKKSNALKKRYAAEAPWGKKKLRYKIEIYGNDLPASVQDTEFEKAFKMWTDAVDGLDIKQVRGSETADINIRFASGTHSGCPVSFDGIGHVAAHAFPPEDDRVHFDEDEEFTDGAEVNGKVNLLKTAAHEIGHALGLGHSHDASSIMRAEFQPYTPNLGLSQDDIEGIRYLYNMNTTGDCQDEFWCEDIIPDEECEEFQSFCKVTCGVCT